MDKNILDIYNTLQEIAWHFGNHGVNGECCGDLSLVEFMALKKIYENNISSIQEIGNDLNFTKSGATRIIDRLESKEYVTRERSSIDGRVCCVFITHKGITTITRIIDNYTTYLSNILKEIESKNVECIKESLDVLLNAIQRNKSLESSFENNKGGGCC